MSIETQNSANVSLPPADGVEVPEVKEEGPSQADEERKGGKGDENKTNAIVEQKQNLDVWFDIIAFILYTHERMNWFFN